MKTRRLCLALILICAICNAVPAQLAGDDNTIITNGPVTTVRGGNKIQPARGSEGTGTTYNFLPYILPGQYANPRTQRIENLPFDIAYASRQQPLQTSDWWTGIGLQWSNDNQTAGWVVGRKSEEGRAGRSKAFIAEPFHLQFVDYGDPPGNANSFQGLTPYPHGLRLWNQNHISVRTGAVGAQFPFDPTQNFAGRGNAAEPSPIVTVGLRDVHPLGTDVRTSPPWSNAKVQSYSDWGAVVSYADTNGEMTATMASSSPFVWFERTKGQAPFLLWAGDPIADPKMNVWYNEKGVIGVTVTTLYVPFNAVSNTTSTAAYVIFADQGSWTEQKSANDGVSLFTNGTASRVAVLAMPHNINPSDPSALIAAMTDIGQYACQKIVDTRLHYPPVAGSDASVNVGGQTLPLGFDEKNSVIRTKLQVTTVPFALQGCDGGNVPLQLAFPHHRKAMIADSKQNIPTAGGAPKYTWNSMIGEFHAYEGASYVRELTNYGALPFLPSVAVNSDSRNPLQPGQLAVEDIYQTMKTWFFIEEPVLPGQDKDGNDVPANINSFVRNLGTYINVQTNTYIQSIAAVYESLDIADQLARSPQLSEVDPDFGRSKQTVAAEMRDILLQTLKELTGQWADVYTAQFFQYNSQYNSFYGFPDGYGSIQNFNDHHFHYGYFLRAAAAVGRYDKVWLDQYMPLIDQLRRDVATYDRADQQYPFLREFSPFYGHNWADGTGQDGNNQESASEAMNFSYGLIELGQVLGDNVLRDLGLYMFEEEKLTMEQYWMNLDADLTRSSGTNYNGNWPDAFVHYTGPDGAPWKTTLVTNVSQSAITRSTFFGGVQGVYTIQQTPLSAYVLFFGRDQNWLKETWKQYLLDSGGGPQGTYEVIVAGIQAQLPQSGDTLNDVGLTPALRRLNTVHNFFPGTTNTMGKHWAYTLAELGHIDSGVIADTTTYAVFNKNGQRTYVAYNPTPDETSVTFTDRMSGAQTVVSVPAFSMVSEAAGVSQPLTDEPTRYAPDTNRLYLRADRSLTRTPGDFLLPAGETPFPGDTSALDASLVVVPVRSDQDGANPGRPEQQPPFPPPAADVRTWSGTFSGRLINESHLVTRFSIYTNQSLFPGWQQDPSKAGNNATVRFLYDFDSDENVDRIEVVQNAPLSTGNAFLYENKITEYIGDNYYGGPLGSVSIFIGDSRGGGLAPYPSIVTNGTLTVQVYGGSNINPKFLHPFAVSVEASPLTNRASWVKPPYQPSFGSPPPPPPSPCATWCFRAPQYYLNHLWGGLPKGKVWIAGSPAPVNTKNVYAIGQALKGGNSAQKKFNREYIAAQLSLLAADFVGGRRREALNSTLACYGLSGANVVLSNGARIGAATTLRELIGQAKWAARAGKRADWEKLAGVLDQLNSDDPGGSCAAGGDASAVSVAIK